MIHAHTLSLFPLDSRCTLLTNLVWDRDKNGVPCLSRQKLWVGFPAHMPASGLTAEFGAPVGLTLKLDRNRHKATWDGVFGVERRRLSFPRRGLCSIRADTATFRLSLATFDADGFR